MPQEREVLLTIKPTPSPQEAPRDAEHLPALTRACRAGDDLLHGTLFEAENLRFLVRASGTDALLRYYVESANAASVAATQKMLRNLEI